MQTNHYFENYINNLQKEVFLQAYDNDYEIVSFINAYMKSTVRQEMDKQYSSWHNQPASRIFEEFLSENDIKTLKHQSINRDAVEWLGFFYSKWHFLTGETSKTIIRFLPAAEGLKNYYALHQLDELEAIEISKRYYNLSRNNHRSNEYKNSDESKVIYSDPIYYSFLAVRILYKLTKNPIFNVLNYIGDRQEYDFMDDDFTLAVKGDVLFKSNNESLIEEYGKIDGSAVNYSKRCEKSIYFCFVFSDYYEIDDNNDEKLIMHIKELKTRYSPNNRQFKHLYFYMLGKLYEITPNNELYIYSIPFSKRERIGIINKMKHFI